MALVYDGLLIIAVVFVAFLFTIPFTSGFHEGLLSDVFHRLALQLGTATTHKTNLILSVYLFSVVFLFFAWFWTHGGQTLGMRTWKIRMVSLSADQVTWVQALMRFVVTLPVWAMLIYTMAFSSGKIDRPIIIGNTPDWAVYLIISAWLVFDQLPNNWRDKLCMVQIIKTSNNVK